MAWFKLTDIQGKEVIAEGEYLDKAVSAFYHSNITCGEVLDDLAKVELITNVYTAEYMEKIKFG